MFTKKQIQSLLEIIDIHSVYLVGYNLGMGALSDEDKTLLRKYNVQIESIIAEYPPFLQAFLFGRLAALLGEQRTKMLTYSDFVDYIKKKQWEPLSTVEKKEYEIAQNKTYTHIKSFGDRIRSSINTLIADEVSNYNLQQDRVISEEISISVLNRLSLQTIVSNIGKRLNNWKVDWGRIVDTELQDIYNRGKAVTIKERFGSQQKVYKDTYPGACRYCIKLHTTSGIGSEPITFTLDELYANGTNVGKQKDEWLAVIGPTHPFCRCDIRPVLDGQIWDKKNKRYKTKAPEKIIERKNKIKIEIGSQKFEV